MPERSVKVSLVAQVSGYISGMQAAAQKTRELGSESEKLNQKREAIEGFGKAAFSAGAVAAAGVALAAAKYAEFDQAISSVQAATHASADEMVAFRDAAIDAGANTVFTATEAANAIEELAKAGVSSADILGGGLSGALDLASAGELKVADAAQIAATAMTQFNVKGSEVPHIADLLAAGAGKAQGSVSDLSQALNQGGLVASQAGFSIEETTGTLAAFASAGLLGSDAGTSLKTAIIQLQNPSKQASATMKQYGIDVYDSSGNMLSFGAIAEQLQTRLGKYSDEQRNAALATIFGNDAVRAANVLYSEGADGIADWTTKVNDNGYAAETARIKLDNLKGDVEKLGGAFDTAIIKTGSSANGSLRELVQTATFLVDTLGSVPQPVLAAGLGLGVLTAAVGLTGGAALIAVPKFAAFKAQLDTMGVSLKTAALRTVGAGAAFTGITLGIGALVAMQARAKAGTEELTSTLDEQTGALTKYSRASVARRLEEGGEYEAARKAGITQRELTDAVLEGGDALDAVQKRLGSRNTFGGMFTGASYEAGVAQLNIKNVADSVQDSQEAFRSQKDANEGSGQTAASVAEQYKQEAAQVSDLANELSDLVEQFNALNGVNQDAISANASYQEALAGLADQVAQQKESTKGYTTSLDENTAIGAGNASMLSELANKAQEAASKQLDVDRSTMSAKDAAEKYAGTLAAQRRKFIESATAAGFNAGEVKKLADRVFQLPSEKQISILANTKQAQTDLDAFITRNDGRVISVRQQLITEAVKAGAAPGAANAAYKAAGGPIYGPGTGTSDSIPAMLSNGEYVVRASSVDRVGLRFLNALNDGSYTPRRYAVGGPVTPTYVQAPPMAYAATSALSGVGPQSVSFSFPSSGSQAQDMDKAMMLYKTKVRGGR